MWGGLGVKRCEPSSRPIHAADGLEAETAAPCFRLTSHLMFLWVEGVSFSGRQQFPTEKITFLKTLPGWELPLWQKARLTFLLPITGGVKVKVDTASLRKHVLLLAAPAKVSSSRAEDGRPGLRAGRQGGPLQRQGALPEKIPARPGICRCLHKAHLRSFFRTKIS